MQSNKTIDSSWHPLVNGCPPVWASEWGQDRYGVWLAFTVKEVRQCLRWVPPGSFLMGSPADEAGRLAEEDLPHPVVIQSGFWLFDTPVTQALWQAVMGNNPSHFKSSQRPVESVSWDDAQQFLHSLNQVYPELQLTLPSEIQWEYACRARTDTATYAGPMEILGDNHAPVLDSIAWYGGNSGLDFELENGVNSSGWPDKQYDHEQAGSHPVAKKRPNPWGLYDMLGNVWEWCGDDMRDDTQTTQRVVRGGSWSDDARDVRATCRVCFSPGKRNINLGFRCARVQI